MTIKVPLPTPGISYLPPKRFCQGTHPQPRVLDFSAVTGRDMMSWTLLLRLDRFKQEVGLDDLPGSLPSYDPKGWTWT